MINQGLRAKYLHAKASRKKDKSFEIIIFNQWRLWNNEYNGSYIYDYINLKDSLCGYDTTTNTIKNS